jgi:hypothetical protein
MQRQHGVGVKPVDSAGICRSVRSTALKDAYKHVCWDTRM